MILEYVKFSEIQKEDDLEWCPSGYRIIERGCGCCETDIDGLSISIEDADEHIEWLKQQIEMFEKIKSKLKGVRK